MSKFSTSIPGFRSTFSGFTAKIAKTDFPGCHRIAGVESLEPLPSVSGWKGFIQVLCFIAVVFLGFNKVQAQTGNFNMATGTDTHCSGTFYDPGGYSGNYADGITVTQTIKPPASGEILHIAFSGFTRRF